VIGLSLRAISKALGGVVSGAQVLAPGPGHDPRDRSLSVKISASSPEGFLCHSFAGDRFEECRDHVKARLGIERHIPPIGGFSRHQLARCFDQDRGAIARFLWGLRQPIAASLAEVYLLRARGLAGPFPPTLGYLPPRNGHEPAMIAAFGLATEPEPGLLAIEPDAVMAVHLTKLRPDSACPTQ
jgi:hypothetical protein